VRTGVPSPPSDLAGRVRLHVFSEAAETGQVPQPPSISKTLGVPLEDVRAAVAELAAARVLMLAPNDGDIWAAAPFCAVPSPFRVRALERTYWGICIWDALGIPAAIGAERAELRALCGDCGEQIHLEVTGDQLVRSEGVVHFAVPARRWWDNIGFT